MVRPRLLIPLLLVAVGAAGVLLLVWSPGRPRLPDLARDVPGLAEASVAGRPREWALDQNGRGVRINDTVYRTLPASPPSRLAFVLDVPRGAHLNLACGIVAAGHDRPGIEFVVKVRRAGIERRVWSKLIDPLRHAAHRRWVEAEIDLSAHAGREVELILETRGYEEQGDAALAYWGAPALTLERRAPLVVLYLVDTLRADHTSVYGYERDTTPRLSGFARDAIVFEQAIAQASWTKPSVATIFTSLPPHRHGVVQLRDALDVKHVTLAERLGVAGYATGAVISNVVIYGKDTQFEQGFDFYAGLHGPDERPSKSVPAGHVVDAALDWIDGRRGHPRFLFVHTMDPHVPYTPPAPFDRAYPPHPSPGHPGADPRTDFREPADRGRLVAQYDGEIAYGDREFGRFLDGLKARGLYDDALVVFVADHGEEFLDHGQWLHGRSVFDELVRVPLVVKLPDGHLGGRRIAQQVTTLDIVPTILRELDLAAPAAVEVEGRPLQDVCAGTAAPAPAISEISHRGHVAYGIRSERDKYVRRFSPERDPAFGDTREMLFDLVSDPRERINALGVRAERAAALRPLLEGAMLEAPYRTRLRAAGGGTFDLRLTTRGWFESVETRGFDARDSLARGEGELRLRLHPRPGQARELSFAIRPVGTPVNCSGSRDGRPLRVSDVMVARAAAHPAALPFHLPEPDADDLPTPHIFEAPERERPGVQVWLEEASGRVTLGTPDKATCQELLALGYVAACNEP